MKAEERKRLETNVLADRMGRMVKDVRKGPSRRGLLIWVVLIVAAIGMFVYWVWNTTTIATESELWVALYRNTGLKVNKVILAENKESTQAKVARFQKAWLHLWEEGIQKLYVGAGIGQQPVPSITALANVKAAESYYEKLNKECKDDPILGPEAWYCLGIAKETLAINNPDTKQQLESAKSIFEDLVKHEKFKYSAFANQAKERLKSYKGAKFAEMEGYYRRLKETYYRQYDHDLGGTPLDKFFKRK